MARTPLRFAGPAQVSNAAATKYTAPASTLAVLRHIHIQNPGASATFTMSIGTDAVGVRLFDGFTIAANSVYDAFCYYILQPAEIIQAFSGTNNQLVLTLDGDQITLG